MVKIMDVHNPSIEAGGYLKNTKHNKKVKVPEAPTPECFWSTTLSKKGRGVKIRESLPGE